MVKKAKELFVEDDGGETDVEEEVVINDGVKVIDDEKLLLPDMSLTKKGKPRKKRPPLSEERKEVLREQLRRGRETSNLNRQKTAQAKKILKKEHNEKVDMVIRNDLMKKSKPTKESLEIAELKKQLEEMRQPLKTIIEDEPIKVYVEDVIKKPKPIKEKPLKPLPEMPPPPPPPKVTKLGRTCNY